MILHTPRRGMARYRLQHSAIAAYIKQPEALSLDQPDETPFNRDPVIGRNVSKRELRTTLFASIKTIPCVGTKDLKV